MSHATGKSYKKEALKATLEKQKACTAKALKCVEELIEKNVTENELRRHLPFINQSSYQDIVDERSITDLCGYPLCSSQLKNIPKKQYTITRCNGKLAVFDTTERKKFCSNICYKASKYLNDQLPSCPLWLMETTETTVFKLIPLNSNGGSLGEEIAFAQSSVEVKPSPENKKPSHVQQREQNRVTDDKPKDKADDKVESEVGLDELQELFTSIVNASVSCETNQKEQGPSENKVSSKLNNPQQESVRTAIVTSKSGSTHSGDVLTESALFKNSLKEDSSLAGCKSSIENNGPENPKCVFTGTNEEFFDAHSDFNTDETNTDSSKTVNLDESPNTVNKDPNENIEKTDHNIENSNMENHAEDVNKVKLDGNKALNERRLRLERNKSKKAKHKKVPDISPMLAAVLKTEKCIREWVSIDTLHFLFGKEKLKAILEENGILSKMEEKSIGSMQDPYVYERYIEICNRLNILDLKDSKLDKDIREEPALPTKPLPDFKKLEEEAKEMELKVRTFYAGDRVQFAGSAKVESEDGRTKQTVLPLVDHHAQKAHRRRIVLDHLNRVLPDILRALGVTNFVITRDVKDLVSTFALAAHNVVFKPAEWNVIAIIIVKLLSVRDEALQRLLTEEKASKYLTLMLMSYEQDGEYLNRLMIWLLYEHALFKT